MLLRSCQVRAKCKWALAPQCVACAAVLLFFEVDALGAEPLASDIRSVEAGILNRIRADGSLAGALERLKTAPAARDQPVRGVVLHGPWGPKP
jgi:hypothetical protein